MSSQTDSEHGKLGKACKEYIISCCLEAAIFLLGMRTEKGKGRKAYMACAGMARQHGMCVISAYILNIMQA